MPNARGARRRKRCRQAIPVTDIWFLPPGVLILPHRKGSGMSSNGLQGVAFVALVVIIVMAIFGGFGVV